MLVTRDSLRALLENPSQDYVARVIGRALIALLENQTRDEQYSNATTNHNNIGFTGADARSGSLTAKYFRKHGKLLDWQIDRWTKPGSNGYPRLCKYWKQLNEAAEAKAAKANG